MVIVVPAAGLATLPAQPAPLRHDQAIRVLLITGLAFLAGAAVIHRSFAG